MGQRRVSIMKLNISPGTYLSSLPRSTTRMVNLNIIEAKIRPITM